ncbi:MAG: hypothetical protein FIO02_10985 [Nitrosopumilales archaeon]|nr:hypothetical protein [Nitrosopumilales archaeon]
MQQKITILAVGILTAAMFTTTLVMTVQSAFAKAAFKCSPRNPNVCTQSAEGRNTATTTNPNPAGNTAISGSAGGTCVIKNGHFYGTGCV